MAREQEKNLKLKMLRERSGMSQSQLAKAAGVNYRTLQDYDMGKSNIDGAKLKTLLSLCLTLGCRLDELVEDPELINLINAYEEA